MLKSDKHGREVEFTSTDVVDMVRKGYTVGEIADRYNSYETTIRKILAETVDEANQPDWPSVLSEQNFDVRGKPAFYRWC